MDQPAPRVVYEFGDFCVDATQRLLRARSDGEPIQLTSKAFETLLRERLEAQMRSTKL